MTRVLIVDDDEIALDLLHNTLSEAGYEVGRARDGWQALELVRTGMYRLVVSDWQMPGMSGLELCRRIRARDYSGYVYLILVTVRNSTADAVEGLGAGADDFISKPYDPVELCMRLRTGERVLALESRNVTIFALARLAESRDPETGAHLERIREYSRLIAQHLSRQEKFRDAVDGDFIELIYLTSPLHDIGKVGIPDKVLLKPARLSDREFEVMKQHTLVGAETLDAAVRMHPEAKFLHMARDIALTHHERFDGGGYPYGLAGTQIPLCGRIVALADVYDALTTRRVYKDAYSHEKARSIILEGRGTHFDPDVVDAFLDNEAMFVAIRESFADEETEPTAAAPSPQLAATPV
jgi:putative two-component system response regulator